MLGINKILLKSVKLIRLATYTTICQSSVILFLPVVYWLAPKACAILDLKSVENAPIQHKVCRYGFSARPVVPIVKIYSTYYNMHKKVIFSQKVT